MGIVVSGNGSVVIVGTGGFAVELAGLVRDKGIKIHGFLGPVPDRSLPGPHLGEDADIDQAHESTTILIAIGDPAERRRVTVETEKLGRTVASFVHPGACVAGDAFVGSGVIIYPHATVHAGVKLGHGVLVNSNATVGHETVVGEFCTIGPGAALGGRVVLGDSVYVGIGASFIENLGVASGTVIGAGATVVHDIAKADTYVGTPARPIGT